MLILDRATGQSVSPIEKMKLSREGSSSTAQVSAEYAAAKPNRLMIMKLSRRISEIIALLMGGKPVEAAEPVAQQDDQAGATRNPTAQFYDYDQNRKPAQRKKENAAAMALLAQIESGEVDGATLRAEQKQILAKYSGTGGALIGADGKKGSAYEYYTPKPIAEGIWDLMGELGFSGGKVLDPCSGSGIFGATAPSSALVDAV